MRVDERFRASDRLYNTGPLWRQTDKLAAVRVELRVVLVLEVGRRRDLRTLGLLFAEHFVPATKGGEKREFSNGRNRFCSISMRTLFP